MDVKPTQAQAADDQELAKVLESMNSTLAPAAAPSDMPPAEGGAPASDNTVKDQAGNPVSDDSSFVMPDLAPLAVDSAIVAPTTSDADSSLKPVEEPEPEPEVAPEVKPEEPKEETVRSEAPAGSGEFDSIKKEALNELKPLVDKLDLPPEDKFNTLLLIIRSTDDKSLVPKAHEAAKTIEDESKRAAALLDIIKEIDYFSNSAS